MNANVDTSDLDNFAKDLEVAHTKLGNETQKILMKGGLEMRRRAGAHLAAGVRPLYLKHYERSVTYDLDRHADTQFELEFGSEIGKLQGRMGPGVEYGSSNTGPIPHILPAFAEELPIILRFAAREAKRAI